MEALQGVLQGLSTMANPDFIFVLLCMIPGNHRNQKSSGAGCFTTEVAERLLDTCARISDGQRDIMRLHIMAMFISLRRTGECRDDSDECVGMDRRSPACSDLTPLWCFILISLPFTQTTPASGAHFVQILIPFPPSAVVICHHLIYVGYICFRKRVSTCLS